MSERRHENPTMDEFTGGFWTWYISIPTVLGILAMFGLIKWLGRETDGDDVAESTGHVWDEDLEELNNPLPRWWLNMFYITLVFGLVYLVLYPGLGEFQGLLKWTDAGQYEQEMKQADEVYGPIFSQYLGRDVRELVNDPSALKIGRRLYASYCGTCHGADARGVRGFPNLRDLDWLWGGEPSEIKKTITNGRVAVMPPWGDILSNDDIFNVAEYVRGLSGRAIDGTVAAKGEPIYQSNCAVCHGSDGTGNRQLGAPNLSNNVWLYGGSQKLIMESIRMGRQGRMPAHGEFLGEAKIHLLTAYVFGLTVNE